MFSIEDIIRASSVDRAATPSITPLQCGATLAAVKAVPYSKPLPGVNPSAPYSKPLPGVNPSAPFAPPESLAASSDVPFGPPPEPAFGSWPDNMPFDTSPERAPTKRSAFRYPPVTSMRGYSAPDLDDVRRWSIAELTTSADPKANERTPSKPGAAKPGGAKPTRSRSTKRSKRVR